MSQEPRRDANNSFPLRKLREGDKIRVCGALLDYTEKGILRVCDPYGCEELNVSGELGVLPAPPIARPFRLGYTVYVEFSRKTFVDSEDRIWVRIPFELEIYKKGRAIARATPVKSKYTLVGSLVEGLIARFFRVDPVKSDEPPLVSDECSALALFYINSGRDVVRGIPFNASQFIFYKENNILYYSLIEVNIKDNFIESRTTSKPPKPGLVRYRKINEGRGIGFGSTSPIVMVERGWRLWPGLKE